MLFWKKHKMEFFLGMVMFLFVTAVLVWNGTTQKAYKHYSNTNITYVKGVVKEVSNDELEKDKTNPKRYLGAQQVKAEVLEGKYKGQIVEIENYLTASSNVYVEPGMRVILSQDKPEGSDPYFLIYNYYRSPFIYGIILVFFCLMMLVGGAKGVRAIAGLVFTLFTIVLWLIPMIYTGFSPVLAAIATVVITTAVTLFLLNGFSKKTLSAIIGTALGVVFVGILFAIISECLHISGYNTDETEFMVLIAGNTKLKIAEVLFAGVLISSLGAVMDVGMSIASAIYEVYETDKNLTAKQLFLSGLNVGKDMIGTMSNTLILAFTGSGLATLLVLTAYGIKYHQFLSSDFLAIEVGQGLSGTMAVILTVPLTSFIASLVYKKKR